LSGISDVTRARHLAWLAYNLVFDEGGQRRAAADEAAAAAAATGDLEARIMADVTHALLDAGEGYPSRALRRFEEVRPLAHTNETALAHAYAGMYEANLLAVVGRLDDATARVAGGIEQAGKERNAMALAMWAVFSGLVHLAAGRLSAARDATESLPPPQPTGATEHDVLRTVILAEVAAHTDDRNLLQQMVNDARDAHARGSAGIRRGSAYVLARAAWQRDDVHDAMRWLGDVILLATPFFPHALVRLILGARVASAAGDAGLRARVLQATEVLERERPTVPLLAAVAGYARAILEHDAQALVAVAESLRTSPRPLLYASAAEDAGAELARAQRNAEAIDQLNAAFDTYIECGATADARRIGRALRGLGVERRIVTHPRARTGWDSLTDSELKVINLIAEGATNRSVAQQLRLSPHTVKTHVRNAFAKLGITSRAQLAQLTRGSD
jgi:DNA-binding CsgD family transcriptional regulator